MVKANYRCNNCTTTNEHKLTNCCSKPDMVPFNEEGRTMNFTDVQTFFKSWGLYPFEEYSDAEADSLNPEVVCEYGINRRCYEKLIAEATLSDQMAGSNFAPFCSRQIDATDDSFYLSARTWAELEEAWHSYIDPSRH